MEAMDIVDLRTVWSSPSLIVADTSLPKLGKAWDTQCSPAISHPFAITNAIYLMLM
jgi:hypothetical protein